MWISKKLAEKSAIQRAERGTVTVSSASTLSAESSQSDRNVSAYTPYGYQCAVPVGEEVMLLPAAEGQALIGTKNRAASLLPGEVALVSKGGASIRLCNDGSIYLNGVRFIDKTGVILPGI